VSISLPGLARFGCDLSATVGGIPNFGQAFRSRDIRERSEGLTAAVIAPAAGWLVISPAGWRVFHQLIQELRLVPWPRSPPAAIDDRAFAGTRNPATRNPSLLRKVLSREWHSVLCGALATAGRRRIEDSQNRPIHPTQRQFTSWALWAADAAVNALLGLRRSMNSTPAASSARRTAKSLATVSEVLSSASSARLIVLSPSDDSRARSPALRKM